MINPNNKNQSIRYNRYIIDIKEIYNRFIINKYQIKLNKK